MPNRWLTCSTTGAATIPTSNPQRRQIADTADVDSEPEPESNLEPVIEGETEINGSLTSTSLPRKHARDSATDGREMVQFSLQDETKSLESRGQTALEEMLDEDVNPRVVMQVGAERVSRRSSPT